MHFHLTKQSKTILLLILTVALLGGVSYGGWRYWQGGQASSSTPVSTPTPQITPSPIEYIWQTFRSDKFGFSFEYPKIGSRTPLDWEVAEFGIVPGGAYDYTIRNGSTSVSVWIYDGTVTDVNVPTFEDNRCITRDIVLNPPDEPNATIAGEQAYLVRDDTSTYPMSWNSETQKHDIPAENFSACFTHNGVFFEVLYGRNPNIKYQEDDVFVHLLETFIYDDLEHSASIPSLESL